MKVVQIFLEDPKPNEFGSLYCKGQIKYLRFELVEKPIKWVFGKNEYKSCIVHVDQYGIQKQHANGKHFTFSIHEKGYTSVNDGSLDWDDLSIPAISFHEYLGNTFCPSLDFYYLSLLKAVNGHLCIDTNSGVGYDGTHKKLAVLGKKLKSQDLIKELNYFVTINTVAEFRRLISSLCIWKYGSAQFSELCKFIKTDLGYQGGIRGGAQAEVVISDHFKKVLGAKSNARLPELIPSISTDDIMTWYNGLESSPILIDPRTFFKFVACNGNDITTEEPIYISKYDKKEIGKYLGVYIARKSSNQAKETKNIQFLGALESLGSLDRFNFVHTNNFVLKDGNHILSSSKITVNILENVTIFETLKKNPLYPYSNNGITRGITIESIDNFQKDLLSSLSSFSGIDSIELVPWPNSGTIQKYNSHATATIAIKNTNPTFELYGSHEFDYSFCGKSGSEQLSFIDRIVTQSVLKENGTNKWNSSNKSNLVLKERREDIAKKLEDIYFAIERPLRFILKASLGFPNISRAAIILNSSFSSRGAHEANLRDQNQDLPLTIVKDELLSNIPGSFSKSKNKICLDCSYICSVIDLAMAYGSFKALEQDARKALTDTSPQVTSFNNGKPISSMGELFAYLCSNNNLQVKKFKRIPNISNTLDTDSNFDPKVAMIIDKEVCYIDLSILSYNLISGAFFIPLLSRSIENESMLNIDGIKNPLVSPKDYFAQYLEGYCSNVLLLNKSIYA